VCSTKRAAQLSVMMPDKPGQLAALCCVLRRQEPDRKPRDDGDISGVPGKRVLKVCEM